MAIPRIISGVGVALGVLTLLLPQLTFADAPAPVPHLQIQEIDITGDEFIIIKNDGTAPALLKNYWLGYTSDESGTAAPAQQLSDQTLAPGVSLALTHGPLVSCGADDIDTLSFSLANTAGQVALWQLQGTGQSAAFTFLSSLTWGKITDDTPPVTPDLLMANEKDVATYETAQTPAITDAQTVWYRTALAGEATPVWHDGFLQNCTFTPVVTAAQTAAVQPLQWRTEVTAPPFTVAAAATISAVVRPSIPAADIGLKAPQLSEILPNPASPQTDADDEFIELYNPNGSAFDLGGFILETGSTTSSTTHQYTFPAGTSIAGKSFQAFYSADTHLSLSNGGGQVWLLDPLGTVIGKTDAYDTAKDGQAWMDAGSAWQWTFEPSPGKANTLAVPTTEGSSTKAATVKGQQLIAVKGVSTGSAVGSSDAGAATPTDETVPIHPWVLAAVIAVAILYGAYEYRTDIANRLYQFRRNRADRRDDRR